MEVKEEPMDADDELNSPGVDVKFTSPDVERIDDKITNAYVKLMDFKFTSPDVEIIDDKHNSSQLEFIDKRLTSSHVKLIDDKLYCCQVCNMMLIDFSKCSADGQAKILQEGRPMPKMGTMVFYTQKGMRKYFSVKRYEAYEWLTGCEGRGKLFCWPCILFSKKGDPWATIGFSEGPDLTYVLKKHGKSPSHLDSMVKWKTIGKVFPGVDFDDEPLQHAVSNNWLMDEVMTNNIRILKRLIRVFCFLSVHELCSPLTVEEEPTDPIDQGKYEQFLSFIGKYDEFLEKQLVVQKTFLSSTVRRQIILSISEVVTAEIVREVFQANFVSIIVDEVAEMGSANLVSTIVRYVGKRGDLRERFLNFKRVPASRRADSFFHAINENVALLECPSKLVSLSFDGGVVNVHEISQLQTRVKKLSPSVCFLHYCEHRLISVLAQSLSTIKLCKRFFFTLNGLAMSFLKSKKLSDGLNSIIRKKEPKAKDFIWNFNGHLISNVNGIRHCLIKLFQSILESKNNWDFESVMASSRFLPILARDIPFNFLLLLLDDLFLKAVPLSSLLDAKSESVGLCIKGVKEYTNVINSKRRSLGKLYSMAVSRTAVINSNTKFVVLRLDKNIKETCNRLGESVILNLMLQLNSRFSDLASITFLPVTDLRQSISPLLTPLPSNFVNSFDTQALQTELNALWESSVLKRCEPRLMLKKMRLMDLDSVLPWTAKLCELSLALPMTKASSSTLKRVDSYIRTTSLPHRLSPLALLKIEKELVDELSEKHSFYDEVIRVFFRKRNPHSALH